MRLNGGLKEDLCDDCVNGKLTRALSSDVLGSADANVVFRESAFPFARLGQASVDKSIDISPPSSYRHPPMRDLSKHPATPPAVKRLETNEWF